MKTIMKNLNKEEEYYELIQKDQVYVFLFSANWCPDCLYIKPFIPDIIMKYASYEFVYVDRDQFLDLCIDQNIFGIPSFVVTKKGKELGRFVSKDRKTQKEIEEFLDHLKV